MKNEYEREGAVLGLHQPVEFESEMITLDIPLEGIMIKGWNITPLIRPVVSSCEHRIHPAYNQLPHWSHLYSAQVTKKQVDNFREGKLTPCCQLKAEIVVERKKIPTLTHQVVLKGAKYPNDIITIDLPVRGTTYLDCA